MTMLAIAATVWLPSAQADNVVLAVRLGADDVPALARFYQATFGLKEIDRVGEPPTEIIMRYGATVEAAKAGSSPEFLIAEREGGSMHDEMAHAIFHVSDIAATLAAAKAAGATIRSDSVSVPIGGTPIKIAVIVDPDGNVLEIMELPNGLDHLPH
jgi:catechol 2,3-dioxygenase-like lactoylglutathione lyase family enzyme